MSQFLRYYNTFVKIPNKKVESITLKVVVENCDITLQITDIMLQEGAVVTGYIPNTAETLLKYRVNEQVVGPVHFNLPLRGRQIIVIPNRGTAPGGSNMQLTAKEDLTAGTVVYSSEYRAKSMILQDSAVSGDVIIMKPRQPFCAINDVQANFTGGLPRVPAWDVKLCIDLVDRELAYRPAGNLLFTLEEYTLGKGGERL